jgi:Trypsin-like serine proteases, typically periplasmic, contain C-terminal PDZ domain
LKSTGKVSRGWIGVYVQEISADLAQSFKMSKPEGALVAQVIMSGPAARVLNQGDVILSFAGKPVANAGALPPIVGSIAVGESVAVDILREGKRETVTLTVGEQPTEAGAKSATAATPQPTPMAGTLGLQVTDAESGIVVDAVIGEPARSAGIVEGDIIIQLDGKTITSSADFKTIAATLEAGKTVAVLVQREGSARFLAMKIEPNARE